MNKQQKKKIWLHDATTRAPLLQLLAAQLEKDQFELCITHHNAHYHVTEPSFQATDVSGDFGKLRRIVTQFDPDVAVFFDKGGLYDRGAIYFAQKEKITTIQLQHGMVEVDAIADRTSLGESPTEVIRKIVSLLWFYCAARTHADWIWWLKLSSYWYLFHLFFHPNKHYFIYRNEVICDQAICFTEKDRYYFEQREGYPSQNITTVGSPYLDAVYTVVQKHKPSHSGHKVLLWLSQPLVEGGWCNWTPEKRLQVIDTLYKTAMKANYRLIVKIHPIADRTFWSSLKKKYPKLQVNSNGSVADLVAGADCVVGFFSTTLEIPVIFGKPLGILRFYNEEFVRDYDVLGVAETIKSERDLQDFLQSRFVQTTSYKYARKQFLDTYIGQFDGNAMSRIVKIIETV